MRGKIVVVVAAILTSFTLLTRLGVANLAYEQRKNDTPFGEITINHSLVAQVPVTRTTRINRISICMATYGRTNTCSVDFYLYKNGQEMYRHTIEDASTMQNNSYYDLEDIDLPCTSADEIYLVITSPDANLHNTVTAWMYKEGDGPQVYAYDWGSDKAENYKGTPKFSVYEKRRFLDVLYRSYQSVGWFAIPVLGILVGCVVLLVKELLPLEELRRNNHKTHP